MVVQIEKWFSAIIVEEEEKEWPFAHGIGEMGIVTPQGTLVCM